MKTGLPLPEDKKLSIIFRVEPGCLGPQGSGYIDQFCDQAQNEFKSLDSDFIIWNVVPRSDKSLPEIQFALAGKRISSLQAEKYLALFGKVLDDAENAFDDKLESLIVKFLAAV